MHLLIKKFVVIENILCCGSEYTESVLRNLKTYFWKDVFKALSNLQHQLNVDWDKSRPYQNTYLLQYKSLTCSWEYKFLL